MKNKKWHIISRGKKWAVRQSESGKAKKLFIFKTAAVNYAKKLGGEVIIHNKDGLVLGVK